MDVNISNYMWITKRENAIYIWEIANRYKWAQHKNFHYSRSYKIS